MLIVEKIASFRNDKQKYPAADSRRVFCTICILRFKIPALRKFTGKEKLSILYPPPSPPLFLNSESL